MLHITPIIQKNNNIPYLRHIQHEQLNRSENLS